MFSFKVKVNEKKFFFVCLSFGKKSFLLAVYCVHFNNLVLVRKYIRERSTCRYAREGKQKEGEQAKTIMSK